VRRNRVLRELNLRLCRLSDASVCHLAAALHANTALTSLSLRGNYVGDEGAASFGAALRHNTGLRSLVLDKNALGPSAHLLGEGLLANPHSPLEVLSLYWTRCDNAAMVSLARAMRSSTCRIATLSLQGLQGPTLEEGGLHLAHAIGDCTSLQRLDLKGAPVSTEASSAIQAAAAARREHGAFELFM